MHKLRLQNESGFTLIELLVVVAIIGILAAIAIPQFSAYRKRGYEAQVKSDLRNAATAQEAYDEAVRELFGGLDTVERRLESHRYLAGEYCTEADWRLFATLVRFDIGYYGAFKCNLRRIEDYPALSNYLRELYQWPGIAETVWLELARNPGLDAQALPAAELRLGSGLALPVVADPDGVVALAGVDPAALETRLALLSDRVNVVGARP